MNIRPDVDVPKLEQIIYCCSKCDNEDIVILLNTCVTACSAGILTSHFTVCCAN